MALIGPPSSFRYLIEDETISQLAQTDVHVFGVGEHKAWWAGKLCSALKMKTKVSNNDFDNIFSGHDLKGKGLLKTSGSRHKKGWDLTFSPPKPVSVLWATVSPILREYISWKNKMAALKALHFLEEKAAYTRCGKGGEHAIKTIGFVVAMFEHCTSRANDMQLHIHMLVANLSLCENFIWRTLDSTHLFEWAKSATLVYLSQLALGLTELGFEIQRREGQFAFDIKGICLQICLIYSKRTGVIKNKVEMSGIENIDVKSRDLIALQSREPKIVIDINTLLNRWQSELHDLGLAETDINKLRIFNCYTTFQPLPIYQILKNLTNDAAVFNVIDIYKTVAVEAQFYKASVNCIENTVKQVLAHDLLKSLGKDRRGRDLYTTKMMIDIETLLTEVADELRSYESYKLDSNVVQKAISSQVKTQGFNLSEEQVTSIHGVCQTGLDILQGRAGAGKSTSMKAMRIAYESQGYVVKGATVAKKAAKQLENDTGIKATTFASTLLEIGKRASRFRNTVILIDEAGLIPSIDLLKLFAGAKIAGAKIVLVGETEQLKAIKHSGCLSYLAKRFSYSELKSIYRQRLLWARTIVTDLRAGESRLALNTMKAKSLLNIAESKEGALEALVNKWEIYIQTHKNMNWMIMAYSWKDVKPLNDLVREKLKSHGAVSGENISIECVVSDKQLSLEFSVKDRVRFTENDYSKNFINGDLGTITYIKATKSDIVLCIKKDSGEAVRFMKSEYVDQNGLLQLVHAYASTIFSSQGSTIDGDTFVLYSTSMDRAASYVAGSRHKENCHWFVNGQELDDYNDEAIVSHSNLHDLRLKTLARCMRTERGKVMALEYLDEIR
jgi:conjugative relaxase-like TrwC/TraI family protein